MVRLTIHRLMSERGITAYALSRGTGLPYPSAYRLSRPSGSFGRLHADTLDRLCKFFQVQPGELLRWTPKARGPRVAPAAATAVARAAASSAGKTIASAAPITTRR